MRSFHTVIIRNRGFTLLELSIVILIIGVVTAGILVGRDLMQAASIRAQISQLEKLNTSLYTFRSKYQCIPGDCKEAVAFGLGTSGGDGDNGDGTAMIEYRSPGGGGFDNNEIQNFWYHLGQSQLIPGTYPKGNVPGINSPALVLPGQGVGGNPTGGVWLSPLYYPNPIDEVMNSWALASNVGTGAANDGVYNARIAHAIDTKLDDGLPITGNVRVAARFYSFVWRAGFGTASGGGPTACINDSASPYRYNVASDTTGTANSLCTVIVKNAL